MGKKKRTTHSTLLGLALLICVLSGCTSTFSSNLGKDFGKVEPVSVLILSPYFGSEVALANKKDDNSDEMVSLKQQGEILKTLQEMTRRKLENKNYNVLVYGKKVKDYKIDDKKELKVVLDVLAKDVLTEAFLFTEISTWEVGAMPLYASLTIAVRYKLVTAKGKVLWEARYETSESELGLDKEAVKFAIHNIFEPRLERLSTMLFTSLPKAKTTGDDKTEGQNKDGKDGDKSTDEKANEKKHFDWLP
ncbi:MAG: hypothetical protein KAT46_01440 [Deltaproteobacteria bacterium]|nr:hypothetical protein [Deltaproteobacteria bacterium]